MNITTTPTALALLGTVLTAPVMAATDGSTAQSSTQGRSSASVFCNTGFVAADADANGAISRGEYDSAQAECSAP